VALAVYQGLRRRRSSMPTAGSQEIAYQQIMSPAPMTCLPTALEGSMAHRQEYRSIASPGDSAVSRVNRPRS
jgi:hypothetical protein